MNLRALFGLSILMSFVAFVLITKLYIWPQLHAVSMASALTALVAIHMYRFIGLGFLVPGVAAAALPSHFARPAAFGDLGAAILAVIATLALSAHASWALFAVWVFNIWGAGDLLYAMVNGPRRLAVAGPGTLGAMYFVPTLIVPALLVTHGLIFWLLLRSTL
ncbi:MAG TPA: hypothetical protein VIY68_21155 [Steroidobacteraceae bacterium]